MPTMYQMQHPDYGWVTFPTLDDVLYNIREEINANDMFPPDELVLTVRIVEMSQEAYDAMPKIDE